MSNSAPKDRIEQEGLRNEFNENASSAIVGATPIVALGAVEFGTNFGLETSAVLLSAIIFMQRGIDTLEQSGLIDPKNELFELTKLTIPALQVSSALMTLGFALPEPFDKLAFISTGLVLLNHARNAALAYSQLTPESRSKVFGEEES